MALTQISTAGVKDDAVTAGKIPANAVGSSELADNAVDTAAIAADAVTTAKVAAGNITATELGTDSVTGAKIAAGAINNANKIQDSIITGAKIGSGTIAAGNIASNAITTAKIADGNVTKGKIENLINNNADNRVITGSGSANTLEGEANLTWDATTLKVQAATPALEISGTNSNGGNSSLHFNANANHWVLEADNYTQQNVFSIKSGTTASSTPRFAIDSNGHARFGPSGSGGDTSWSHSSYGNSEVAIDSPTGYSVLHFRGEGAGSTATRFAIGVGDGKHYLSYDDVDARHNIVVSGDGVVSIPNGIELGSGTDATPAGNILHDYEEGTFTPVSTAVTLSGTVVGHYTKIGDLVYVSAIFDVPSTSNTSDVEIHGLPFNAKNGTDGNFIQGGYTIYTNQGQGFNVLLANNQNTFVVYNFNGQRATFDDFSNKILRLAGVYKVA